MSDLSRVLELAEVAVGARDERDLSAPLTLAGPIDWLHQNIAYFGDAAGPLSEATARFFEVIAASNQGGSGSLPTPPPFMLPSGVFPNGANMAAVKATFDFLGVNGENWQEDWWTPAGTAVAANPIPAAILAARLALLSSAHKLQRVRFLQDDASRLSAQQDVFRAGTQSPGQNGLSPTDLAAVLRLAAAGNATRGWWLRGLNDNDWTVRAGGTHVLISGLDARIAAFVNAMSGASWGVRPLVRVPLRPPNVTFIVNFDGRPTPGLVLITTTMAHGLVTGDECIIYRTPAKNLPRANGHFRVVTAPTATTFTVPYRVPDDGGPIPTPGAFVRKAVYAAVQPFAPAALTGGSINPRLLHIAHHDTKEGVFGSRGASRAKRTRQSP